MDKQVRGIDAQAAMGIPDESRDWFVYDMMKQAQRNNSKMAAILEHYEKKLEFLATSDQETCPICLEAFSGSSSHVAETLGCCHKVCKDCWDNWSSLMRGRPFCPLCRHEPFLGAIAAHVTANGARDASDSDED